MEKKNGGVSHRAVLAFEAWVLFSEKERAASSRDEVRAPQPPTHGMHVAFLQCTGTFAPPIISPAQKGKDHLA